MPEVPQRLAELLSYLDDTRAGLVAAATGVNTAFAGCVLEAARGPRLRMLRTWPRWRLEWRDSSRGQSNGPGLMVSVPGNPTSR